MINKVYKFECEDCKLKREYPNKNTAQDFGWAIARGGKKCYCPTCAFYHRNTGTNGPKNIMNRGSITIGKKIYEMRTSLNMSLRDFANFTGISSTIIERLEAPANKSQKIDLDTVYIICKTCNYNFAQLLIETKYLKTNDIQGIKAQLPNYEVDFNDIQLEELHQLEEIN